MAMPVSGVPATETSSGAPIQVPAGRAFARVARAIRSNRKAAVGAILLLIFDVTPSAGPAYTLLAFVIVITGGLGSMPGALVGGVLIGFTEAMAGLLFTPSAKSMFSFAILVLVLFSTGIVGALRHPPPQ